MEVDTRLVHAGRDPERNFGVVNPPVYRASTIVYSTMQDFDRRAERKYTGYAYGLYGTPTTMALAEAVAELSGGHRTVIVSSGLAAVTHGVIGFLRQGDHVLLPDSAYGPTRAFGNNVLARFGVDVGFYDPLMGGAVGGLIKQATRLVYVESPGSHTFEVQDIPAIVHAAHAAGALVVMDNTWATPLLFRAFEHGVDVEVMAGTKYLAGHSDLLIGTITTRDDTLFRTVKDSAAGFGDCPAPDVCYETLRGLRTLAVRLRHHERSALEVARWLAKRPEVARLLHPAFPHHPGHEFWKRDFRGSSSLFGILLHTSSHDAVAAMIENLQLFKIGASFGGFESLILPAHPAENRTVKPWRETGMLLRLHIGLEAVADLIADLEEGFARLNEVVQKTSG